MKLDLFEKLKKVDEEKLHPKFKLLRDEIQLSGARDVLLKWTDGFYDRDRKIIKEFQTTFHSSFWEIYLNMFLKQNNFEILQQHDRPDFIVTKPVEFNMEAVVAQIKQTGRKEDERTQQDIDSMLLPPRMQEDFYDNLDEAIIRYANAITNKSKLYKHKYSKCEWVNTEAPFIIALSSYDQINYGREYIYPMIALLYGWYFNVETDGYIKKEYVIKPGTEDSKISIGVFDTDEYSDISAILFSCTMTLGKLTSMAISESNYPQYNRVFTIRHDVSDNELPYKMQVVSNETPEYLDDGLFIFHNPLAKNKLSREVFKGTNVLQVWIDNGELRMEGENLPLVSRYNISKLLMPEQIIQGFIINTLIKYNNLE